MTPGEHHSLTELVREMRARARDTARRCAEIQATAAELTVIAEDLCSRSRAERERARELASERLDGCHTDAVVHLAGCQPSQALNRLSPSRAGIRAAIRRSSSTFPSAVAVPTAAIRRTSQGERRV